MKWLDRKFTLDLPAGWFPAVVERLRGTPARLEERVRGVSDSNLTRSEGGKWSIKEHIGHLAAVERLWEVRHDEFLTGKETLFDPWKQPKQTAKPDFNAMPLDDLLARFRQVREHFVGRLEALTEADIERTALHQRLNQPMRLIDSCYFAAEHDDHHLARIAELIRRRSAH